MTAIRQFFETLAAVTAASVARNYRIAAIHRCTEVAG